jgi:CheY-like chemotaxis protein
MQGSIEVNSKLGLFTCFNIKLPLKAAFSSSPEQPFFQPNLTDTGGIGSNKQRGSSTQTGVELVVLGVDDNEINRRVLAAMLKKLGHKMIEASSGEEAIGIVKSGVFIDLILMDCEMPKMNGFETTRAIKQWQYGQAAKPCPIIALTAHVLEEHEIRCADAGMDGRLCKPLHLNDLKALLLDINAEGVAKH